MNNLQASHRFIIALCFPLLSLASTFGSYYIADTSGCASYFGPSIFYGINAYGRLSYLNFTCAADNAVYSFGQNSPSLVSYQIDIPSYYYVSINSNYNSLSTFVTSSSPRDGFVQVSSIVGIGVVIQVLNDGSTEIVSLFFKLNSAIYSQPVQMGRAISVITMNCNDAFISSYVTSGTPMQGIQVTCSNGYTGIAPANYTGYFGAAISSYQGFTAAQVYITPNSNGGTISGVSLVPYGSSPQSGSYQVDQGQNGAQLNEIIVLIENNCFIGISFLYKNSNSQTMPPHSGVLTPPPLTPPIPGITPSIGNPTPTSGAPRDEYYGLNKELDTCVAVVDCYAYIVRSIQTKNERNYYLSNVYKRHNYKRWAFLLNGFLILNTEMDARNSQDKSIIAAAVIGYNSSQFDVWSAHIKEKDPKKYQLVMNETQRRMSNALHFNINKTPKQIADSLGKATQDSVRVWAHTTYTYNQVLYYQVVAELRKKYGTSNAISESDSELLSLTFGTNPTGTVLTINQ